MKFDCWLENIHILPQHFDNSLIPLHLGSFGWKFITSSNVKVQKNNIEWYTQNDNSVFVFESPPTEFRNQCNRVLSSCDDLLLRPFIATLYIMRDTVEWKYWIIQMSKTDQMNLFHVENLLNVQWRNMWNFRCSLHVDSVESKSKSDSPEDHLGSNQYSEGNLFPWSSPFFYSGVYDVKRPFSCLY
jgi:hypothetical protein